MTFSQTLQIVENDFLILYENLIPVQQGSFLGEAWQEGGKEQHSMGSWGLSPHTLKLRLSPKDDGSSEEDPAHEDVWPTEAGLSFEGQQAPEGLECCLSRQLRGNEDHSELMAWILLPVTQPGKRLWTQATWCSRFRLLPFYLAHRG